jgi:hypothetical protein
MGDKDLLDYSLIRGGMHAFTQLAGQQSHSARHSRERRGARSRMDPAEPSDKQAKMVREFGRDTPMRPPAQPEEIAPAYVFLASPQCSSYITGGILPIIGGYSGGQARLPCFAFEANVGAPPRQGCSRFPTRGPQRSRPQSGRPGWKVSVRQDRLHLMSAHLVRARRSPNSFRSSSDE